MWLEGESSRRKRSLLFGPVRDAQFSRVADADALSRSFEVSMLGIYS